MMFNDPIVHLVAAPGAGAAVGGLVVALLARWSANSRIKKIARMYGDAVKRRVESGAARQPANEPRSISSGPAVTIPPPPVRQYDQFGEYQETWDRLTDLRVTVDRLWERPTKRNADEFSRHLEAVRTWLYANKDVKLDDEPRESLRRAVDQLEAFRDNKRGLHDLMRERPVDEAAVNSLTDRYNEVRKQLVDTIDSLPKVFRQKMA